MTPLTDGFPGGLQSLWQERALKILQSLIEKASCVVSMGSSQTSI